MPDAAQNRPLALIYGLACHGLFALGAGSMVLGMYHGLTLGLGPFEGLAAVVANTLLVVQFPLVHSFLLTDKGRALLGRIGPAPHGKTLATSTYAMIASVQLAALFWLWSPSGTIWWSADGVALWAMTGLYALSWALLGKSILDSGWRLQSGALGWLALFAGQKPRFPDLPQSGLFRVIRQPIYVAFALTLWTVPIWTPDQLALALAWTAYCLIAPLHKERRFEKIYGDRFEAYRARVPYAVPGLKSHERTDNA